MTKKARRNFVNRLKRVRKEAAQAAKRHKRAVAAFKKLQRQYRRAA